MRIDSSTQTYRRTVIRLNVFLYAIRALWQSLSNPFGQGFGNGNPKFKYIAAKCADGKYLKATSDCPPMAGQKCRSPGNLAQLLHTYVCTWPPSYCSSIRLLLHWRRKKSKSSSQSLSLATVAIIYKWLARTNWLQCSYFCSSSSRLSPPVPVAHSYVLCGKCALSLQCGTIYGALAMQTA